MTDGPCGAAPRHPVARPESDRDRYDGRTLPTFLSEGEERAAGQRAAQGHDDALVGAGTPSRP